MSGTRASWRRWSISWVREADALLENGGDAPYLSHWIRESGLADLFPSLRDTVHVGISAGSMVLTPRIGEARVDRTPPSGDDRTLGVVDFSLVPHRDSPGRPENTMAEAERWAAGMAGPAYAVDARTAIEVTDIAAASLNTAPRNHELRKGLHNPPYAPAVTRDGRNPLRCTEVVPCPHPVLPARPAVPASAAGPCAPPRP
ncbi:Type 1 glutamine amidotransferase-like domain-containing protein [Streptomyces hokutonensis]|uniref:Type 1 glutamine amidotransferase-like domain-containing protein n=1 Tax=Streptomyces hokutonensis TaxID=1306990 RepID=UPI0036B58CF2